MNSFLFAAGIASAVTFSVHTFIGGPRIVPALQSSQDIPHVVKQILYGCWHFATITLLAIAGAFMWAAIDEAGIPAAQLSWGLAVLFFVWSAWLTAYKRLGFFKRPQWALFLCVSALGAPGLI